jgi:quinoprotein glucose dehydrogenase
MSLWRSVLGAASAGAVALASLSVGAADEAASEWRFHSGDNGARKYSPLAQITRDNVATLQIAWRRPQIDPAVAAILPPNLRVPNNFRSTPLMVKGVMYASNGVGLAEAFDPETGRTLWVQKPGDDELRGGSNRGVAYWSQGADERLFSFRGHSLFALNPKTGEPVPGFGDKGAVDLNDGLDTTLGQWHWTSAPLVVKDVVVMGSAMAEQDSATKREGQPGDVRGYDVHTGKLRWTFHVVPRDGEDGRDSWEDEAWRYTGAGNVWALMSADEDLGYVYLPTTSVTNDMYGGHRKGNGLFSDCIVCIDVRTGRRVWYYQTVHHDLFDYDNPAAPILADITVNGRTIKALVQITKQSFAYVLDRTSGTPVWPIEERPVPQSDVPGEKTSPTQPFPTKPPPFDRQSLTDDDLIDFTPELRAMALDVVKRYRRGPLFTPPSVVSTDPEGRQGTIQLAGSVGGADWTGAAFDPETGRLYVPSMTNPFVANLVPGKAEETNLRYHASDRRLIQLPNGLPLTRPPYGRITAIDLNRGEQLWMVPNGDGPRNHPLLKDLHLPPLGQAVRAAPLVTKTLLFVTEGDQINVRTPPGGGGRKIRAYDKATGRSVWEYEMDAGSTGTLMTYLYKGRQYLVVAIGGQNHPAEFVAFALPRAAQTQADRGHR